MKKFYNICLLIILLMFGNAIAAQTVTQLSFYSPLISTFDMKYINNHLVVAQNGLLIFDVSDPSVRPKKVAQVSYPSSFGYNLAVQNNYAYLAEGGNGIFAVYNISNFQKPV